MKRVVRIVLGGLLWVGLVWGQGSSTIYQPLFTNVAIATTTNPVRNIGQIGHEVILQFSNNGMAVCSLANSLSYMQASYTNAVGSWFGIGQNWFGTQANQALSQSIRAIGAYPYVRFVLVSFDAANCRATANYTGSVYGSSIVQVAGATDTDVRLTSPVTVGGIGFGGTSSRLVACDLTRYVALVAGVNTVVSNVPSYVGRTVKVCGFALYGLAGSSVYLYDSAAVDCSVVTGQLTPTFILNGGNVYMGSGIGILAETTVGRPLCGVAAGADAGVMVSYTVY